MVQTQVKEVDIVIPLGASNNNFFDLRYTLRSIEKNVRNYRDIWIIGDLPRWIQGVGNIPHSDDPDLKWKERNIWKKFMAACLNRNITDTFLATNDDIFIIDEIDATKYPFYYKGTCLDSMKANKTKYRATMSHTKKLLERRGFKDLNADTHTPILYNKKEFLSTFEDEHWLTPYGYGIKSLYCAFNKKPMVYMADCKLKKKYTLAEVEKKLTGRHVVSCTDAALKAGLGEYLQQKFPTKSSYER